MKHIHILMIVGSFAVAGLTSCKKEGCTDKTANNYNSKAKKDDGTCTYDYAVPSNYQFTDANGNSTVSYAGQTDRLNQLREIVAKIESGQTQTIVAQDLKDMFANVGGNGNGNFSFTSTRQLKDKCFSLDQTLFEQWLDSAAIASQSYTQTATNGQAGILSNGTSTYLFSKNGFDVKEMTEKLGMSAVFMYQALNVYFGSTNMSADNSTPVAGQFYTAMEHYWDEAFGYFGVNPNFPTVPATDFWSEYCQAQNATLNSNSVMMNNFLKGRAAIVAKKYTDRDAAITAISTMWEKIAAKQAITYLEAAKTAGNDATRLHKLSEAYGFVWSLRYAPDATRKMTQTEVTNTINLFGNNLWNITVTDINAILAVLNSKY